MIRKLGYEATAVWNGHEALNYLIAAHRPDTPHPKPDVIVMDVQMPVIDGYHATHLIRHHNPYKSTSGTIPIVAMTASAIQGDREKCMLAGMDDYVAKPVKIQTLERILGRWAVHRHVRHSSESDYADSECTEDVAYHCGSGSVSSSTDSHLSKSSHGRSEPLTTPDPDPVEGVEEVAKTLALRVEQPAVAAGEKSLEALGPYAEALTEGQELTVENVGRLESEDGAAAGTSGSGRNGIN